ncbi:hypothetical protein QLH51_00865 [Sphingomonas sp. 2R-10]|uniref:hypothetical protein n=1 Tax=Sphingomonas sp. 2R-10 TaxID=3045148 RepID=UPI0013DDD8D7|nr:hypothetical protein [Sphingomonas sp. 2R-10]MDJ0275357.1 hypothetical protein [Sphingomonas sp. 2R-10]
MSDDKAKAAAAARTRASVHEAIGKLIGDDAAKDRGAAERPDDDTGDSPKGKRKRP